MIFSALLVAEQLYIQLNMFVVWFVQNCLLQREAPQVLLDLGLFISVLYQKHLSKLFSKLS